LFRQKKDVLEEGIEKAKQMLTCIFKQVQAALDMRQVVSAGPFIYLVLQEVGFNTLS
jgi:cell division control protein 45